MKIVGLKELENMYRKIERTSEDIPRIVGEYTYKTYMLAFKNAPFRLGRLRNAITFLTFKNEGWVISAQPPTANVPYHVYIEKGIYPEVFPKYKIRPEGAGRVAYMRKTVEKIAPEFFNEINGKIKLSIK